MLYVLRQKRKFRNPHHSCLGERAWLPVALFDDENHYRGVAAFHDKAEAESYMQLYNRKLIEKQLLYDIESNPYKHISEVSLRIFTEEKIPMIGVPSSASKHEALQEQRKEQDVLAAAASGAAME